LRQVHWSPQLPRRYLTTTSPSRRSLWTYSVSRGERNARPGDLEEVAPGDASRGRRRLLGHGR
ncbi:MAG TPA: hypothetical protein VLN49_19080, partial [Gemmatimonadaceae bacterium]|nr:hypothetical protein [Gemmatimonadaceae bacterium]